MILLNKQKNPFKFSQVKKKIISELREFEGNFIILKIPVVSRLFMEGKLGIKLEKLICPKLKNLCNKYKKKNF